MTVRVHWRDPDFGVCPVHHCDALASAVGTLVDDEELLRASRASKRAVWHKAHGCQPVVHTTLQDESNGPDGISFPVIQAPRLHPKPKSETKQWVKKRHVSNVVLLFWRDPPKPYGKKHQRNF